MLISLIWPSALSVLQAVFVIDRQWVNVGKQPALGLGQVQVEASRQATGVQKLLDFVHMGARLVLGGKLLQRNERRGQCFRAHPFVVARDSLSWHSDRPFVLPILAGPGWNATLSSPAKEVNLTPG